MKENNLVKQILWTDWWFLWYYYIKHDQWKIEDSVSGQNQPNMSKTWFLCMNDEWYIFKMKIKTALKTKWKRNVHNIS